MAHREIFTPFDAEAFGSGAHLSWYDEVERRGSHGSHGINSADDWWVANVGVGVGYYSYGMPHPATQADVDQAHATFVKLAIEVMRDRRLADCE